MPGKYRKEILLCIGLVLFLVGCSYTQIKPSAQSETDDLTSPVVVELTTNQLEYNYSEEFSLDIQIINLSQDTVEWIPCNGIYLEVFENNMLLERRNLGPFCKNAYRAQIPGSETRNYLISKTDLFKGIGNLVINANREYRIVFPGFWDIVRKQPLPKKMQYTNFFSVI